MRRTASILTALALAAGTTATLTAPTATAAPAAKKAKPAITLKVDKSTVEVGKKVTLKGTIKPKKGTKGDKVTIQQKSGDKPWKTQAKVKVNGQGKFTWTDKPSTPTVRKYRAVLPQTKKHGKVTSKPVTVAAATWRNVRQMKFGTSDLLYPNPTWVADTRYNHSLETDFYEPEQTAFAEVNLFRKCYKLKAQVALGDLTESGSAASMRIKLDGTTALSRTVDTLGATKAFNADISGAYRIRFEAESTTPTAETHAAFLSPSFLCSQ